MTKDKDCKNSETTLPFDGHSLLLDVSVDNGKYRVIMDKKGLRCLRHGEKWRDCVGDNLIYWLATEVQELRECVLNMYKIKDKVTMCNCMTKTPHPFFHAKNCPVYMADKIKRLEDKIKENKYDK